MTIPLLDLFKKLTGRSAPVTNEPAAAPPPVRAVKKPASERLSKTVLPHATRSFSPPDPFRGAGDTTSARTSTPPLELGARRITTLTPKPKSSRLPPALARALEPKLERAISLRIADFIDGVPAGYIKPVEILDTAALVSLKASEIEKGMPDKNPTISLSSLYYQVPEIFLRGVRPDDDMRVALPYEKVLGQFKTAHVREDQMRDPTVPQLDTPILKATIQDSERFGTKIEPIETSSLPRVPMKPATAESIAAAEPEATVQQTTKSTSSGHPVISLYSPELKPKSEPPGPGPTGLKIPFDTSPNGTGASASERVPASSGPPVPTPLPLTPELAKVPFHPPAEKPKAPPTKTEVAPLATKLKVASAPAKDEMPITLSLKVVLQNLPRFQLNGDVSAVSAEDRLTLPLRLSETQLASGRVSISPDVFQAALPEKHRDLFEIAQASALAGVKACAITFSDGLSLAGELPEKIAAQGLCAMAPAILERIAQHVRETKLGSLVAVTIYTSGSALSFFAQRNICMTALHAEGSLPPQTRTQIAELVEKLSRTYAQPEAPHVDH